MALLVGGVLDRDLVAAHLRLLLLVPHEHVDEGVHDELHAENQGSI